MDIHLATLIGVSQLSLLIEFESRMLNQTPSTTSQVWIKTSYGHIQVRDVAYTRVAVRDGEKIIFLYSLHGEQIGPGLVGTEAKRLVQLLNDMCVADIADQIQPQSDVGWAPPTGQIQ